MCICAYVADKRVPPNASGPCVVGQQRYGGFFCRVHNTVLTWSGAREWVDKRWTGERRVWVLRETSTTGNGGIDGNSQFWNFFPIFQSLVFSSSFSFSSSLVVPAFRFELLSRMCAILRMMVY